MANKFGNVAWPEWETVQLIGRGSFGAVYEIQKDIFGDIERAALKVISIPQNDCDIEEMYSDGYDDESITATFQSHLKSIIAEYSLMRKMNSCVNIVNCDDVRYLQHDDGVGWDIFIKMELLTPLARALPSNASEESVLKLGMDMCSALEMCSKYHVIHRDIKPQNIFVSDDGVYKLGDFGIAKTVEKTMGGTKIGTYKYMAPEVYNNRPYGTGADIYSLGLVMYWLLNERRMPFLPLPPAKIMAGMEERARQRRFEGEPLPPPAHGSDKLKQIVLKACAYNSKDRYASATEMMNALKTLQGGMHSAIPAASASMLPSSIDETKTHQSPTPNICICFLNTDGTLIQSHSYCPGESVTAPEMAQEFEDNGERYRFVGWNPPPPTTATDSVNCQVVYEKIDCIPPTSFEPAPNKPPENTGASSVKNRKKLRKLWLVALLAMGIYTGALLFIGSTGWKTMDGNTYYYSFPYKYKTGFQTIDGNEFYFNSQGILQTGWKTIAGKKYYFGKDGVMRTGWQTVGYSKYYFNDNGVMQTGWQTIDGDTYYFKPTGERVSDWYVVDAKEYRFSWDGRLISDR